MDITDLTPSSSLGICLGASTVTTVQRHNGHFSHRRFTHNGKVGDVVCEIIGRLAPAQVGVTGRKFRNLMKVETVSEPEAVELAFRTLRELYPGTDSILSAGSESFLLYTLDDRGRVRSVNTGSKCASGTGEFFLQQIQRMKLGIEEAVRIASAARPYEIAGRCSVFSKSDCTHALNKGVAKARVTAGLCKMMAVKMMELLRAARSRRVLVVGGVSQNRVVMDYLREAYPEAAVPVEAPYFEALGALLWAEENGVAAATDRDLVNRTHHSFETLPDLNSGRNRVDFKVSPRGDYAGGDHIVGLDVGSTTTKAVLMRCDSRAIVASEYLRTSGDPVGASRQCYSALLSQLPPGSRPRVIGLGVTGSGRQLAGLHAGSSQIINEIMAHATAAVYYDPEVDTIFEIGGQDAKYTRITNTVPTDYAMNEACAAGTGSFLEEACRESFGIDTTGIAPVAIAAGAPPDFSDQCSAFISSDVKTAVQEGGTVEDSVAGLVYSVCQNYLNRVKGNRTVGRKIFMQGGVCYNSAVPLAMANLCGQFIVVPPDPGLMGAFGAALEVQNRLEKRLAEPETFDLADLAAREIEPADPFTCRGGPDQCDRKCAIDRYRINGRLYPFGGACDRFYNTHTGKVDTSRGQNLVKTREEKILGVKVPIPGFSGNGGARSVGIPASLYTCTAYPLYAGFFANLGLNVIRGDRPDPVGMEAAGSSFCFPVLQGHGLVKDLLERGADHIFVPHVKRAHLPHSASTRCTCPFVQGEPYYLRAAFAEELEGKLLTGVLDFEDLRSLRRTFVDLGRELGYGRDAAAAAFDESWRTFSRIQRDLLAHGDRFLESLEPTETALVLFGPPYNAFTGSGNLGIPQKFASRGYRIVPYDFLPMADLATGDEEGMFWASGQGILQAARFVSTHPGLFGVFITNFSCGPDSFIIERFRSIMDRKPFLTLELDSHTADAGIDTRIEAFLDVVAGYRQLDMPAGEDDPFVPATSSMEGGRFAIRTSDGRRLKITDPRVRVVIPSMGHNLTAATAAAMRYAGVRATALPAPDRLELHLGKGETSCKECLPYTLTAGSLLRCVSEREDSDEILAYFMPEADGPCRFGQYNHGLRELVRKNRLRDVAIISLTCENGYAGMPTRFTNRASRAVIIADALDDVRAGVLALARDRDEALAAYDRARDRILESLAADKAKNLLAVVGREMKALARLPRIRSVSEATRISLTGEIYVRRDGFSRQYLVEKLAEKGVIVRAAPVIEWYLYILDYVARGTSTGAAWTDRIVSRVKRFLVERDESRIQRLFTLSGFYQEHPVNIDFLLERGSRLINPALTGEAILTVASSLREVGDDTHGVISIGPFGCMPSRIAESILVHRLEKEKPAFSKGNESFWIRNQDRLALPFLAIETDGNAFPQVVEARLESLVLAANRLKEDMARLAR